MGGGRKRKGPYGFLGSGLLLPRRKRNVQRKESSSTHDKGGREVEGGDQELIGKDKGEGGIKVGQFKPYHPHYFRHDNGI